LSMILKPYGARTQHRPISRIVASAYVIAIT
jgi:hypothetical protein